MSDPKQIVRTVKGMRAAVSGLRIVLDPASVPCPECDDAERSEPCLRCFGVGWVINQVGESE